MKVLGVGEEDGRRGGGYGRNKGLRLGQINQFKFDRLIDEFMRERVKS